MHLSWFSILSTIVWVFYSRSTKKALKAEKLANRLLTKQVENLPLFTNQVNKISSKSIKLSGDLYDELQSAITMVNCSRKSGMVEVVNDIDFKKMYPFLEEMAFLSPQEKLVLILTEEGYSITETALFTGTTDASVRAVKSRVRNKLMQSGGIRNNKRLKILKKN